MSIKPKKIQVSQSEMNLFLNNDVHFSYYHLPLLQNYIYDDFQNLKALASLNFSYLLNETIKDPFTPTQFQNLPKSLIKNESTFLETKIEFEDHFYCKEESDFVKIDGFAGITTEKIEQFTQDGALKIETDMHAINIKRESIDTKYELGLWNERAEKLEEKEQNSKLEDVQPNCDTSNFINGVESSLKSEAINEPNEILLYCDEDIILECVSKGKGDLIAPRNCPGIYSPEERIGKILKYKNKINKRRKEYPLENNYKGRSKSAFQKFRIRGKFATIESFWNHMNRETLQKGNNDE